MTKKKLQISIDELRGVGIKNYNLLAQLGIETIEDLLFYFPFRWDDFSNIQLIKNLKPETKATIQGKIFNICNIRSPYRKMVITKAIISDESGSIETVWYNQPYLKQTLKKAIEYRFQGKPKIIKNKLIFQAPSFEPILENNQNNQPLIPVYSVTRGITPKMIRFILKQALQYLPYLDDFLPDWILKKANLLSLDQAITKIHFPKNKLEISQAKKRLAFNELFIFHLNYELKKNLWQKNQARKISKKIPIIKKFLKSLNFKLTNDQKIALWEILSDLDKQNPMNRLLEGDVGSGKTIVAMLACVNVALNNTQAALMVPSEILASQHYQTLIKLVTNYSIAVGLLTNSQSWVNFKITKTGKLKILQNPTKIKKERLIALIKKGNVKVMIGTHSIIQQKINFKNLSLAIIDEQHRFGVEQRSQIINNFCKNKQEKIPHLLSMTATPIPRSLALTLFGDLSLSIIKQLPRGRKKIITKVVTQEKRSQAYAFIKDQINQGRQAFVICPLIEESTVLETKAAEHEYQKLSKQIFPDIEIGLLHGRLKPREKQTVMKGFLNNKIAILVATSVIEVGVDVPNATIMVIEGAERFGLAQLHQFRGRVGRGAYQSFCLLFTDSNSIKTWKRLKYLEASESGFELAQKDLRLRGPGEFLGQRQSGFSNFTIATLDNLELIKTSKQLAEQLTLKDPNLIKNPKLLYKVQKFNKVHFE
ncbi:MAG: ATP-dependent DNA helicase RecG [Candidatus Moranbacteria bacterium]|nr:ATP-dependent DNA helicase RecG [Candidatus Moranbacteria bacterium]